MNTEKGFLLMAMNNPIYGNMAFNLALTIKANNATIPIVLYTDHHAIVNFTAKHRVFFDEIRTMPMEYYVYGDQVRYFRAKSRLYEMSPFDKTIWLDADVVFFPRKNLNDLFNIQSDFYAQTYNLINLTTGQKEIPTPFSDLIWGKPNQIRKYYNLPENTILPQINSSIIGFTKSDKALAMFEKTKELFDDPNPPSEGFRGEFPDEFFFHVAGAMTNTVSHEVPWTPLYGDHEFKHLYWEYDDLLKNHYGLMTYGLDTLRHIEMYYNKCVEVAAQATRFKGNVFKHVSKRKAGIRT